MSDWHRSATSSTFHFCDDNHLDHLKTMIVFIIIIRPWWWCFWGRLWRNLQRRHLPATATSSSPYQLICICVFQFVFAFVLVFVSVFLFVFVFVYDWHSFKGFLLLVLMTCHQQNPPLPHHHHHHRHHDRTFCLHIVVNNLLLDTCWPIFDQQPLYLLSALW